MMKLGSLIFPESIINTALLILLIFLVILCYYYLNKRINGIEKTYKYLKFLDEANLKLYKEYLKEKIKNETPVARQKEANRLQE